MDKERLADLNVSDCDDLTIKVIENDDLNVSSISLDINENLGCDLFDTFDDVSREINELVYIKLVEAELLYYDKDVTVLIN